MTSDEPDDGRSGPGGHPDDPAEGAPDVPDEDAPGAFVDDRTADEVPEPNEPG
jgi:hypothetical protein